MTAPQMRERELATELDRARKSSPPTEIWSGKALNELLRSIQHSKLNRAQSQALDEDILKKINLTDGTSHGNVGMLKGGGNLDWPDSLKEPPFDKAHPPGATLRIAVGQLQRNEPLEPSWLQDINADFKELNKSLGDKAGDLSPAQYIETKALPQSVGECDQVRCLPRRRPTTSTTGSPRARTSPNWWRT